MRSEPPVQKSDVRIISSAIKSDVPPSRAAFAQGYGSPGATARQAEVRRQKSEKDRRPSSRECATSTESQRKTLWHRNEWLERIPAVMAFMFRRNQSRFGIIALAILLCAIAGCGGPSRDIVGKWRTSDAGAMVWEFSKNGAVQIGSTRGRYILDRYRVKIETPFATSLYQVEFSGDRMILREPNASKLEFTRIR
jgi:hypothetical protein